MSLGLQSNMFQDLGLFPPAPSLLSVSVAKSLLSCPTLCDPIDGSPPGSTIPGTLQARTLEWVAISFSREGKWKVKVKSLSCVRLLVTPWTTAYQAPPSMGFSRQEYWSGLPFPSPGDLLHPEMDPRSPALQADSAFQTDTDFFTLVIKFKRNWWCPNNHQC